MAPAAYTPATSTAVYVAAVPLRAPKGPAQLLMSAGYSLGLWDLQHFMVLLRPDPARTQTVVFDFQPRDPEDVFAALAVLSRSEIPGVVRRRTLRRIPDRRCWLVGRCDGDAVGAADVFSERWPNGLVVGQHDCRRAETTPTVKNVSWSRSNRPSAPAGRRRRDGWMIDNFECAHCALSTVILWFVTGIKIETHVNMKEKLRSLLRQWRDGEDNALLKTVAKVAH